jgi:hypothetical protein
MRKMNKGLKLDNGKPRWDLLPMHEVGQVVRVLTNAATEKYSDENWKIVVEETPEKYFAAAMRHIVAWKEGEIIDPEYNLPHLAHAICNLLFLTFNDNQNRKMK